MGSYTVVFSVFSDDGGHTYVERVSAETPRAAVDAAFDQQCGKQGCEPDELCGGPIAVFGGNVPCHFLIGYGYREDL